MDTDILTILDFIGVISFTISGSLVAARKDMDYLGVCILGIVTAVGGGATRDIIIGSVPPLMFRNPTYVTVAFIVSNIVFFFLYFHLSGKSKPKMNHIFGKTLFWFDTIGLASFTVNGVIVGQTMTDGGLFLCAFLGVITGVGGGVLRDLLANEVPAIFVRHIYALASVAGAILTCLLWKTSQFAAISAGLVSVILIRFLAKTYEWNLPHIHKA
ncbi:MAG: TRIC cation channel family protein [Spirochaetales bacterium]|nr:TRIC cation channel family protein [Spirochaetales bacterium]